MGDLLGYVMDVSGTEAHVRPYRARNELRLHADFADVAVLLCVRGAKSGGISRVVSTLAVHNEMLAHRPELLATLYRGFRWHRLGEQAEGEDRITHHRVPHFSRCGGLVSCRYSRAYIMEGAHESGRPLSARELAALDYFDAIAYRVDMRFEFTLAPGEALFMNSFTTLTPGPRSRTTMTRPRGAISCACGWRPTSPGPSCPRLRSTAPTATASRAAATAARQPSSGSPRPTG